MRLSRIVALVVLVAAVVALPRGAAAQDEAVSRRAPLSCPTANKPYLYYNALATATKSPGWYCTATQPVVYNGSSLTATAAELNTLAGVTAGAVTASKALVVDANKRLDTLVIGTFKLGAGAGTTMSATAAELNVLAGVTAGTLTASKGVVVDSSSQIDVWDIKTTFKKNGTTVTPTAAEFNVLGSVTAGTAAASKGVVADANVAVGGLKTALGGATTTSAGTMMGGLIDQTSTASGTTQNTEYVLNTVTVPASAFNANGRALHCETWGSSAANANAKNYKFYFGATAVATLTGTTDSAKDYMATLDIVRTGSSTQAGKAAITSDLGAPDAFAVTTALAETDTNAIVISFKSANTAAAAASATGKGLSCYFVN